jgi:membrane-associated phospholipid phosphatase
MTLLQIGIRLGIVVAALGAWFATQTLIGRRPAKTGEIGDRLHDLTAPWNEALHRRPRLARAVLIASSAGIDLFGLFLIGMGVFGSTWRPFLGLLILFSLRQLAQALCALPAPRRMIWRHPGFPSLLVTYGVGNDFFFSGHTAIATLGAIEAFRILPLPFGIAAAVLAALEALTVIVLRAHWTLDVLAAIFAAFGAAIVAAQVCTACGI